MTSATEIESIRATNVAVSEKLMASLDVDGTWADLLHDDIVLEFPYGACIGMPTLVKGKQDCIEYMRGVVEMLPGLKFRDIVITPTTDPATLILEYNGGTTAKNGAKYEMTYITVQEFKDGKLALFKEFWNPTVVSRDLGDLIAELG